MSLDAALAPPPSGLVAITADEAGRFTRFAISMQGLRIPGLASRTIWQIGNDIAGNRNGAVEQFLSLPALDWLWFIDDDHAFSPDILMRLLTTQKQIVTPLCLRRTQPFLPVPCVEEEFMDLSRYDDSPTDVVEVQHAGSSGMLIRREVLEAVEAPWFELGNGISEDVNFCIKAREAGFDIHVDLGTKLGHITTAVIWPVWNEDEGRWLTGLTVADGAQLAIEQQRAAARSE